MSNTQIKIRNNQGQYVVQKGVDQLEYGDSNALVFDIIIPSDRGWSWRTSPMIQLRETGSSKYLTVNQRDTLVLKAQNESQRETNHFFAIYRDVNVVALRSVRNELFVSRQTTTEEGWQNRPMATRDKIGDDEGWTFERV